MLLLLMDRGAIAAQKTQEGKRVVASMVILTPIEIASVAMGEPEALGNWVKPILEGVETKFAGETGRRTLVVQVTMHPDREADVAVAGRPVPSDAETEAISKLVDRSTAPRSRIVDVVLHVVAKINGGDPHEGQPLSPPLPDPMERRLAELHAKSSSEQLALIENWARTEAIPLLALMASSADPKFVGVRNLGDTLKSLDRDRPIDVLALTDKNPDYWRAMLEMGSGIPLILAVRVALLAGNGQVDAAQRVVRIFAPFDRNKSAASAVIRVFTALSDDFSQDIASRIRKGIGLHDAGKLDAALDVYDGVLKDDPHSAWAHYERFQTMLVKSNHAGDPEPAAPDWAAARKAILDSDPLYPSMASAASPDELYDLLLRKETAELFQDRSKSVADLLRYADIAVDLGQPGFAAMIYWNVLSNVRPRDYRDRNLIEDLLYCMEQLGVKELKTNFKGDHAAEFARIDAERSKRRRESIANEVMAAPDASPKPMS
jgi:hypothetical protein